MNERANVEEKRSPWAEPKVLQYLEGKERERKQQRRAPVRLRKKPEAYVSFKPGEERISERMEASIMSSNAKIKTSENRLMTTQF